MNMPGTQHPSILGVTLSTEQVIWSHGFHIVRDVGGDFLLEFFLSSIPVR